MTRKNKVTNTVLCGGCADLIRTHFDCFTRGFACDEGRCETCGSRADIQCSIYAEVRVDNLIGRFYRYDANQPSGGYRFTEKVEDPGKLEASVLSMQEFDQALHAHVPAVDRDWTGSVQCHWEDKSGFEVEANVSREDLISYMVRVAEKAEACND